MDELIERESKVGATVFGTLPTRSTRRFFMDEDGDWYFRETYLDQAGTRQTYTIRYEVHDRGILKSVNGRDHVFISGIELNNLLNAAKLYETRVTDQLYSHRD